MRLTLKEDDRHPAPGSSINQRGWFIAWLVSLRQNDVSMVDGFWPPLILTGASIHMVLAMQSGLQTLVVLSLVALYAVRRAAHITWRHWGEPEDNCQRAIRSRNQPHFK